MLTQRFDERRELIGIAAYSVTASSSADSEIGRLSNCAGKTSMAAASRRMLGGVVWQPILGADRVARVLITGLRKGL